MNQEYPSSLKLLLIGNSSVGQLSLTHLVRVWRLIRILSSLGKSSLLLRFTDDEFLADEETTATIGVDFKVKSLEVEDRKYKLSIWVGVNHEKGRDRCLTLLTGHCWTRAIPNSDIKLLSRSAGGHFGSVMRISSLSHRANKLISSSVYDVSSRDSFDALLRWFKEIDTYCGEGVVKMIVGNKVDKVRRLGVSVESSVS